MHHAPRTYVTAQAYAARHGLSIDDVRTALRMGLIPGAIRVGGTRSPWAIPSDSVIVPGHVEGAATTVAAPSTDTPVTGNGHNLTSSGVPVLPIARTVADRVGTVRTRPARALGDLVYAIAAVATTHQNDRDGRCARCGWTWPCPDRRDLTLALLAARDVVVDGDPHAHALEGQTTVDGILAGLEVEGVAR